MNYVPYALELVWLICMFAIVAMSLNLTIGYTGLFNLGQIGFFAIGAFASTITCHPDFHLEFGFFVGVSVGILVSVVVALLIGIPSLRLKGDYFAIATLGFGEIVRVVLKAYEPFALAVDQVPRITFGRAGIFGIQGYELQDVEIFGLAFTWEEQEIWFCIFLALGCAFLIQRLVKSPYGRLLRAVREDEIAAEALGKNVKSYKLQSFLLGAAMASIAGSLWVHHISVFAPVNFTIQLTITFLVMVILGGMGSNIGAIIGAITITLFYYLLPLADFPESVDPGATNLMIFSILIIAIMLFRPQGIMGSREFDLKKLVSYFKKGKTKNKKEKRDDEETGIEEEKKKEDENGDPG
jgi:branched-chain amino acid transport system permease protein